MPFQRLEFEYAQLQLHVTPSEYVSMVTMDYEMKFEEKRYMDKSSEFYGKKGMGWHGSIITHKVNTVSGSNVHT